MAQYNISINKSDGFSPFFDDEMQDSIEKITFAKSLLIWILSIFEIPIIFLTLFALCFHQSHHAASVYVLYLILSDLVQIVFLLLLSITEWMSEELWSAYHYSLITGLYFMACIAFERYLLVSHPHWYKTHHSLKSSCLVSLIIWFVPLIFATIDGRTLYFPSLNRCIAFFIPYIIIILCFVGTWRGLSHSVSITSQKRKLILGSLFLVLLNYTFVILPYVIRLLFFNIIKMFNRTLLGYKVYIFISCLLYLNPLADCLLYLFMRSDINDLIKFLYCWHRSDRHQNPPQHTTRKNAQHYNVQ